MRKQVNRHGGGDQKQKNQHSVIVDFSTGLEVLGDLIAIDVGLVQRL